MKKKVTILIPTWNGKHILAKSLPTITKYSEDNPIVIVDDASYDGTDVFLKQKYPKIKVLVNKKNLGFTKSMNRGMESVDTPYVVFLNNDVYPIKGFLDRPLDILTNDESVAGVNFCEVNSSWPEVDFTGGKLTFKQAEDKTKEYQVLWPSGGSSVLRVKDLKEIGNFREIFSPGYWEDIDLGWRLWKSGKKIIWTNRSRVVHEHETSFSKLDPGYVSRVKQRNELLWHWLNIEDKKYRWEHIIFLLTYTITHPGYIKVVLNALSKFKKEEKKHNMMISDAEIFERVNHEYK